MHRNKDIIIFQHRDRWKRKKRILFRLELSFRNSIIPVNHKKLVIIAFQIALNMNDHKDLWKTTNDKLFTEPFCIDCTERCIRKLLTGNILWYNFTERIFGLPPYTDVASVGRPGCTPWLPSYARGSLQPGRVGCLWFWQTDVPIGLIQYRHARRAGHRSTYRYSRLHKHELWKPPNHMPT